MYKCVEDIVYILYVPVSMIFWLDFEIAVTVRYFLFFIFIYLRAFLRSFLHVSSDWCLNKRHPWPLKCIELSLCHEQPK